MKLIDLLVRELPKRGGWPEGATRARQSSFDTEIYITNEGEFVDHKNTRVDFGISCTDCKMWANDVVTKEQYQSALAASQKVEWSGDGLPPAGCDCEARYREVDGAEWFFFRCIGADCGVAFGWAGKDAVTLGKGSYEFRPLSSEAGKKRDAALDAIYSAIVIAERKHNRSDEADKVYEAIAAGKIPGVKLED